MKKGKAQSRRNRQSSQEIFVEFQAVSKWESGATDPSTTNLMALAKLFGITAEDLLKEVK